MTRTTPTRTARTARLLAPALVAAAALALAGCSGSPGAGEEASPYVTDGKFTVGTGEPAYFPYVINDDPASGEGFEAAIAYAVAEQLGFDESEVVWVRTTFDSAIAPGPKDFDVNLQQFTITDERQESVDFSSPYYSTPQAVITVAGSSIAEASSIAELQGAVLGAATGTTSLQVIEQTIQPTTPAQVFNSNDDAKAALENGQVDGIVVDLPTAFYLTGVELDQGVLIGQLPPSEGISDEWGFLLPKDSVLTADVTDAVDALRDDGTLDAIADEWLGAEAGAPVLQ